MVTATEPGFISSPQPDAAELAAKFVSLVSFTVLAALFGLKTYNVQFRYLTYSRWLVLTLYLLSWAFSVISMVLVSTNNGNFVSCLLSIMVCDVFYSGTKIVIYAWLIEKIYVVTSTRQARLKTPLYRFHIVLMMPYIAIFTLMLIFHTAELEESGLCIIGLQSVAAVPLITYDLLINMYMTILFIRPLFKLGKRDKSKKDSRLHEVALRTLVASVVCLVVSFANIFSLQMLNGRERGLVCLTCCTVDVTINVITIHWVTTQAPGKRANKESQMDFSANQRESNGENSHHHHSSNGHHNRYENNFIANEVIIIEDTNKSTPIHQQKEAKKLYGYTDIDLQASQELKQQQQAPYSHSNVTTTATIALDKFDDSVDSMFGGTSSSIHESQSSRKSLTKN